MSQQALIVIETARSAARIVLSRIRETVSPAYRPERHYMRGRGPACARRGR